MTDEEASLNQRTVIQEMNALPGRPDLFGSPLPKPRAVLIAGDLTQSGWWSLKNHFLRFFDGGGELDLASTEP